MLKRAKRAILIFIMLILLVVLLIPESILFALEESDKNSLKEDTDKIYDIVIVVDESGSMIMNDPENMRKDAAKLFIDLSDILVAQNRVAIVGFGEKINIYLPLSEIGENREDIKNAINGIKSNQNLTDIKLALQEAKELLDSRIKKNEAMVILLTDGKLDINDIPVTEKIRGTVEDTMGKPDPPSKEDKGGAENESDGVTAGESDMPEDEAEILERYKSELLNLCHEYKNSEISIYPIAFTKEANVELLSEVAFITGGKNLRAEKAADIKDIFLEIFRYITTSFIVSKRQDKAEAISASLQVKDYFEKMIFIAFKNRYHNPELNLSDNSGNQADFSSEINENAYVIKEMSNPKPGRWDYNIKGDIVIIYDMCNIQISEPLESSYKKDSGVPLSISLSKSEDFSADIVSGDFEIFATVTNPSGKNFKDFQLKDDGSNGDKESGDNIFSCLFEETYETGAYEIEFTIKNKPSDSVSVKKADFVVTGDKTETKEIKIKVEHNIIAATPSKLFANFSDFSEGDFTCSVTARSGDESFLKLYDNGDEMNGDMAKGDGIYSCYMNQMKDMGDYTVVVSGKYNSGNGIIEIRSGPIELSKEIDFTNIPEKIQIGSLDELAAVEIQIVSNHQNSLNIEINKDRINQEYIENIEIADPDRIIEPGVTKNVQLNLAMKEDINEGTYEIRIPLVLGGVYEKEITIWLEYVKESRVNLALIFISVGITFLTVIFLIVFLIIRMRTKKI